MIEDYFVCVGAQKAGTTWLARILEEHPDIFFTPVKEIHYFDHIRNITEHLSDKKRRSRYRKYHQKLWTQWSSFSTYKSQWDWYKAYMKSPIDDDWYCSLFAHRGKARFAGEATPEYAIIGEDGFRHIKALAPKARVIFIMRDPVARAWSQILHHFRSKGEDVEKTAESEIIHLLGSERFVELNDYLTVLDNLARVFASDQVHYAFYEDIHADRLTALEKICGFIGTDFSKNYFPDFTTRYNRSQKADMPDAIRNFLTDRYSDMAGKILTRIGRIPNPWHETFDF